MPVRFRHLDLAMKLPCAHTRQFTLHPQIHIHRRRSLAFRVWIHFPRQRAKLTPLKDIHYT